MIFGVQWYLWLLLIFFIILAFFACLKASAASRARRERLKKEAAIWKRDYDLRQNYGTLTEKKIENAPKDELLHGVAMNIQIALENAPNMEKAFDELPLVKKYIYTLEYFNEDAEKSLSLFFKNNGEPLIGLAAFALDEIGLPDLAEDVKALYPMYDEESDVSVDYAVIAKKDEEFKENFSSDTLCRMGADYIIKNKQIFLQ